MDLVLRELASRGMLYAETYAPFYVASFAMHVFNLMNQENSIYWEAKRIPNLRLHIVFVAPPGGMKSFTLSMLADEDIGVFQGGTYPIIKRQNMNEAALCGTINLQNGKRIEREGEAKKFHNGVITIDEFSGITDALKSSYNSQMDTQLLAALDHGHVVKSIAGGNIEYDTNFSLWAGVQPARYDIQRGLGRRLCFVVNIPSEEMKRELRKAIWKSKNIRPENNDIAQLRDVIGSWTSSFSQIKEIKYDQTIFDLYDSLELETYDMTSYDRIILGYHLARYGASEVINLSVKDPLLVEMIKNEYRWRKDVINGPDLLQIKQLIIDYGTMNDKGIYEIDRMTLNDMSSTYSMSVANLHDKLSEMGKYGMIGMKNGKVQLLKPMDHPKLLI
jgi:hypothetical protein